MARRMVDVGVRLRADHKGLGTDLRKGGRHWDRYAKHAQRANQRIGRAQVLGGVRRAGVGAARPAVAGVAGAMGLYGVKTAIDGVRDFERSMVDLTVAARENRRWLVRTRADILAISDSYGIAKGNVRDYMATIIRQTGDARLASSTLKDMALVAKGSGAEMADIANIGIQLQNKLGLAGNEWKEGFGILASQAQKGSIELRDMAAYLPSVINFADQFSHKGITALRQYGAVFQVARRGSDSAAEAATSMSRMFDMIIQKRTKIEKVLGIKLKQDGAWLSMTDILQRISMGLVRMKEKGKDAEKFMGTTFGVRGKRTMAQFFTQAKRGWSTDIGSYMAYQNLVETADPTAIETMAKSRRELSATQKWHKATNRLANTIHRTLLPVVERLSNIMPAVGKALAFFVKNSHLFLALWMSNKARAFFGSLRAAGGGPSMPVVAGGTAAGIPGAGRITPGGMVAPGTFATGAGGWGRAAAAGGAEVRPGEFATRGGQWVSSGRSGGRVWVPDKQPGARVTPKAAPPTYGTPTGGWGVSQLAGKGKKGEGGWKGFKAGAGRVGGMAIRAMGAISLVGQLVIAGAVAKAALDKWLKGEPSDEQKKRNLSKAERYRSYEAAAEIRVKREKWKWRAGVGVHAEYAEMEKTGRVLGARGRVRDPVLRSIDKIITGGMLGAEAGIVTGPRTRAQKVEALERIREMKKQFETEKKMTLAATKDAGLMTQSQLDALFKELREVTAMEKQLMVSIERGDRERREQLLAVSPEHLKQMLVVIANQVAAAQRVTKATAT